MRNIQVTSMYKIFYRLILITAISLLERMSMRYRE